MHEILSHNADEACYSVLDVETTGLSASSNNIIEIGILKIQNNVVIDQYSSFINPGRAVPLYITNITGITDDDVYDAPFFEGVAFEINEFLKDSVVVGHNLQFDMSFINREMRLAGIEDFRPLQLCTLKIARRLYPQLKSRSLGNLAHHLNVKVSDAHRATGDAEITLRILVREIDTLKTDHGIDKVKDLLDYQSLPGTSILRPKLSKKMNLDLIAVPDNPGIYYFMDSKGEVIYIGKAKSLRERIRSYITESAQKKSRKILTKASRIKTQTTNSELTALLSEAEMIKTLNPRFNTLLKEYGNKYYLRINQTHKFPSIDVTNNFDFDGNDYFGLFISKRKALKIKDIIDSTFQLRECSDKEFNNGKGCFLSEIERCTSPCTNMTVPVYEEELEKAYDFLFGNSQVAVNTLLSKMKKFSDLLKFEKAGEIKELLSLVLNQIHKSSLLKEPINKANIVIEVTGYNGLKDYLLIIEGRMTVKKYMLNEGDIFDTVLNDYFDGTVYSSNLPSEEDLEKMKITLNWIIKNRNFVRIFYLRDYTSKEILYKDLSKFNNSQSTTEYGEFDVKNLFANMV